MIGARPVAIRSPRIGGLIHHITARRYNSNMRRMVWVYLWGLCWLCACCGLCAPNVSVGDTGTKWALLVGIDDYENPDLSDQQYCVDDTRLVADALVAHLGFPREQVVTLTSAAPDAAARATNLAVLRRLDRLSEQVTSDDLFLLYFSGHGFTRNGQHFLATVNADPATAETLMLTSLPLTMLRQKLERIAARDVIFLIDACRNDPERSRGAGDNLRTPELARDLLLSMAPEVNPDRQSALFFACADGERAYDWPERRHGVFSYFLAMGLSGEAIDDRGALTIDDLKLYVQQHLNDWCAVSGKLQHPELLRGGERPITLAESLTFDTGPGADKTARLRVTTTPPGASVLVEGLAIPGKTTPCTIDITLDDQNRRTLEVAVELKDYLRATQRIEVKAGSISSLNFQFTPTSRLAVDPQELISAALLRVHAREDLVALRARFKAGDYNGILEDTNRILAAVNDAEITGQALYLKGAVLLQFQRPADAIPVFQRCLDITDDETLRPYALRSLSIAQLDVKRYAEALESIQRLQLLPQPAEMEMDFTFYRARALAGCERFDEALATYRFVVNDDPASARCSLALLGIGSVYEMKGQLAEAMSAYREVIAKFGGTENAGTAAYRLGVLLAKQHAYTDAIDAFHLVPPAHKYGAQARYQIAWAYADAGQQAEANIAFLAVAEQYPQDSLAADAISRVGEYHLGKSQYAEALQYFDLARTMLTEDPHGLRPYVEFKAGRCAYEMQQYARAAELWGVLPTRYPDHSLTAEALFLMARASERAGNNLAAHDAFARYLEQYPKGGLALDAALGAGRASLAQGQVSTARKEFEITLSLVLAVAEGKDAALQERGKNVRPEAQFSLGECAFKEGAWDEALIAYAAAQALNMEPWYSKAMAQSIRCLLKQEKKEQAQKLFELLARSFPDSAAYKEVQSEAVKAGLRLP